MSNKRVVARELKQKKKQQKQLTIIGLSVIVLAIIGVFAFYGYGAYSRSYIMVYEGEKVDMPAFQFSLMASGTGEEGQDVKADAVNVLLDYLTLEKHALADGYVFTEEIKAELLSSATQMKNLYGQLGMNFSFIENERMAELLARDNYYTFLLDKYTADYTVDEADFATQLANYKENEKAAYYNIEFKYISNSDKAVFDEGVAKLTADNFDETAAEYSSSYNEETGAAVSSLATLYGSGSLPEGMADKLLALEVGERSEAFALTSGLNMIIEVTSRAVPTDEEVETSYREQYTAQKKAEMFDGILTGWIGEANYTLNQRAYDTFNAA